MVRLSSFLIPSRTLPDIPSSPLSIRPNEDARAELRTAPVTGDLQNVADEAEGDEDYDRELLF